MIFSATFFMEKRKTVLEKGLFTAMISAVFKTIFIQAEGSGKYAAIGADLKAETNISFEVQAVLFWM